ncbi:MAG: CatA-like O-acetyltransferase [Candidatus Izemoplasmatales bacterium]
MEKINMDEWKRKDHFEYFKDFTNPHFSLTVNVDITKLYQFAKNKHYSFFSIMLFYVMKAANNVEEFKQRIRDHQVVSHEVVHPSFTYLGDNELFLFVNTDYDECLESFVKNVEQSIKKALENQQFEDDLSRDDLIYISSLPWLFFTSLTHPFDASHQDSFPRITWGKYIKKDNQVIIPVNVSIHHGLADGVHVGKFFSVFERYINDIQY